MKLDFWCNRRFWLFCSSVTILSVVCGTWIWGWDVSITPVFIVAGLLSGIIGYVLAKASVIRLFLQLGVLPVTERMSVTIVLMKRSARIPLAEAEPL